MDEWLRYPLVNDRITTADMIYQPYTTNTITSAMANWNIASEAKKFSEEDIERLARKIYRVFSEHVNIDISENEFIGLLKEEE